MTVAAALTSVSAPTVASHVYTPESEVWTSLISRSYQLVLAGSLVPVEGEVSVVRVEPSFFLGGEGISIITLGILYLSHPYIQKNKISFSQFPRLSS